MNRCHTRFKPFLYLWEGIMKRKIRAGTPYISLALIAIAVLLVASCRTDQVDVPSLTGPSGHRIFITMDAVPDHVVIKDPNKVNAISRVSAQLKNQLGQPVPGENIKFRITNDIGTEINIGSLDHLSLPTDSGGFARVTYTAPSTDVQPVPVRIYIIAIMTNPAYTFEVTGRHALDLELARPGDDCVADAPGSPEPAFDFTPDPGTINEQVCFDAQATIDDGTLISITWSFGDGRTSSGLTVCHTFTSEGLFPVTLTVVDEDRNCAQITQLVEIGTGQSATCSILVSPQNPPLGTAVNLTAQITDDGRVRRFSWNFGDGTSTTTSSNVVSHLYQTDGSFTVLLDIVDDQGNKSSCTVTVTIGSDDPSCTFVFSPADPSIGDSVLFDASLSTDDDGTIVSYDWSFGDTGTFSSSSPTATHSYTIDGDFTVILTVTDDQGNTTVCSQSITVGSEAPDCDFTASPNPADVGESVNFNASASTDDDGTIDNYAWDFGDGNTLDPNTDPTVSHAYQNSGTFIVTLTLTDNDGNTSTCTESVVVGTTPPVCDFTVSPNPANVGDSVGFNAGASSDPDGTITNYAWDFGDGNTLDPNTDPTVSHVYTNSGAFTATLTLTDDDGNTSSCTVDVTIGSGAPTCDFDPNPSGTILPGQLVDVDASASQDPDGGVLTFAWSFPGGTPNTGSGEQSSTTYNNAGVFTITLTVTDDENQVTKCQQSLTVQNALPLCQFTQDTTSGLAPLTVNFDAGGSTDQDEGGSSITSYRWVFGDGDIFTTANALTSHTYDDVGSYNVTLTVQDDEAGTSTNVCTVTIDATGLPPTALFTADPVSGTLDNEDDPIDFDASTSTDNDELGASIVNYSWTFDDGTPTQNTGNNTITHTFSDPGVYSVTLTVTDDEGQTDSITLNYVVDSDI